MKQLFTALLLISFLSCTKENPATPAAASIQTSSVISYKSDNISIYNFKAQAGDNKVTVGFVTSFQKNVKTLEILRGTTPNSLCSIYKTDGSSNSSVSLQYSTEDTQAASTLYYIVKYTLQDNDWGYTPIYTLQTGK